MTSAPKPKATKLGQWHVGVAAEALAAAQFARCNLDISVQYGANQPEYDLIVARGEALLKVSVKGSQDGAWGLTQSFLKNGDYHGAVKAWEARHSPRTALCFVQFKGVALDAMPRMYLAWPADVAAQLRKSAGGRGETILYESHTWTARAAGAGTTDALPSSWAFTKERLESMIHKVAK